MSTVLPTNQEKQAGAPSVWREEHNHTQDLQTISSQWCGREDWTHSTLKLAHTHIHTHTDRLKLVLGQILYFCMTSTKSLHMVMSSERARGIERGGDRE